MAIKQRIFNKLRHKLFESKLLWTAIVLLTLAIYQQAESKESQTVTYQSSNLDFPNPERGFFISFDPLRYEPRPPLTLEQLKEVRGQNMTLARRYYLISDFRDRPLSAEFLDMVASDLATAREARVKLIIRFTYNWLGGGEDASEERILAHIQQLKPILRANYDAIAYLEAGFIGYWGEWHSSTHNLHQNPSARKKILEKILSALPSERMVALRYTHYKRDALNDPNPLNTATAFKGTAKARIGAHNDCFLYGIDNGGTYNSTQPAKVARQKAFLKQDNLFVVQGGEFCRPNPPQTYCDRALPELAQMRWTTFNYYGSPHELYPIFATWKQQGCFAEISRRLGYRFRLIESTLNQQKLSQGIVNLELTVTNDGWGILYNSRNLEIILRHRETGREYFFSTTENPQFWQPGTQNSIKVRGTLPPDITPGQYQVLLNLPDPNSQLSDLPEYSIRLANEELWEPTTGYNDLQQTAIIPTQPQNNSNHLNHNDANSFRLRRGKQL